MSSFFVFISNNYFDKLFSLLFSICHTCSIFLPRSQTLFSSILSRFYPHVSFGARSPCSTSSPHELGETLFISSWLESTGKDEEEEFLRWGVWWLQTPPVSAVSSLIQINHPPTHVCKIRVAGVGREEEGELYNKRKKKRCKSGVMWDRLVGYDGK